MLIRNSRKGPVSEISFYNCCHVHIQVSSSLAQNILLITLPNPMKSARTCVRKLVNKSLFSKQLHFLHLVNLTRTKLAFTCEYELLKFNLWKIFAQYEEILLNKAIIASS